MWYPPLERSSPCPRSANFVTLSPQSLRLATRFGTPEEAEKIVTLRLKGRSEVVLVGEFEVK